jgi:hypothetical protein
MKFLQKILWFGAIHCGFIVPSFGMGEYCTGLDVEPSAPPMPAGSFVHPTERPFAYYPTLPQFEPVSAQQEIVQFRGTSEVRLAFEEWRKKALPRVAQSVVQMLQYRLSQFDPYTGDDFLYPFAVIAEAWAKFKVLEGKKLAQNYLLAPELAALRFLESASGFECFDKVSTKEAFKGKFPQGMQVDELASVAKAFLKKEAMIQRVGSLITDSEFEDLPLFLSYKILDLLQESLLTACLAENKVQMGIMLSDMTSERVADRFFQAYLIGLLKRKKRDFEPDFALHRVKAQLERLEHECEQVLSALSQRATERSKALENVQKHWKEQSGRSFVTPEITAIITRMNEKRSQKAQFENQWQAKNDMRGQVSIELGRMRQNLAARVAEKNQLFDRERANHPEIRVLAREEGLILGEMDLQKEALADIQGFKADLATLEREIWSQPFTSHFETNRKRERLETIVRRLAEIDPGWLSQQRAKNESQIFELERESRELPAQFERAEEIRKLSSRIEKERDALQSEHRRLNGRMAACLLTEERQTCEFQIQMLEQGAGRILRNLEDKKVALERQKVQFSGSLWSKTAENTARIESLRRENVNFLAQIEERERLDQEQADLVRQNAAHDQLMAKQRLLENRKSELESNLSKKERWLSQREQGDLKGKLSRLQADIKFLEETLQQLPAIREKSSEIAVCQKEVEVQEARLASIDLEIVQMSGPRKELDEQYNHLVNQRAFMLTQRTALFDEQRQQQQEEIEMDFSEGDKELFHRFKDIVIPVSNELRDAKRERAVCLYLNKIAQALDALIESKDVGGELARQVEAFVVLLKPISQVDSLTDALLEKFKNPAGSGSRTWAGYFHSFLVPQANQRR